MKTTNLNPPRARWTELQPPVAAALVIFFLLLIGLIVGRIRSMPSAAVQPTPPLPVIIIASPLPQGPVPTAVPPAAQVAAYAPNALRRAVVAYDAPGGNVLGAIEQGRTYTVLARYGSDWLQANVDRSGVVWLKADQVLDLPADLVDLEPTPAPVVIERPVYVASQPQAAPTPEPYTAASEPPTTMAPQQAAIYDRQVWAMHAATSAAGR
jgi:hypothetical protein